MLSAQPKSANPEMPTNAETFETASNGAPVIELAARATKPEAVETAMREGGGLVMTRPKPEKRKNAKERAKEKYAKKDTEDGTRPMTATAKSEVETKAKAKSAAKAVGKAERKAKRAAAKAA